jgi:hypothetical protein
MLTPRESANLNAMVKDFGSVLNFGTIQQEKKGIASFRQVFYVRHAHLEAKVPTWEAYGWELSSAFS